MKKTFQILFLLLSVQILPAQPSTFESRGIGGGGALFSPSINPLNKNEVYLACDMSELFHTKNFGVKWDMLHFKNIQGGHDSKMQFTKDSNLRLCMDYTSVNGVDYARPVRSKDKGLTWNLLKGNPYPNDVAYHLSADYNNPSRLVLGFYGEIWFSADTGKTFKKIYTCKSTSEGNHIAGTYFRGKDIFLGLNDGLLVSSDTGKSWNLMTTTGIPAGEKMVSFSAGESGGSMRFLCLTLKNVWAGIQYASEYAAWDNINNRNIAAMQGVYVMDNADGKWNLKSASISNTADFPILTGMAGNNISTLYISGGSSSGSPIVMKSTDGGNTWNHVFLSNNNQNIYTGWSGHQGDRLWSYGECPFGFTVAPNDANRVIFTDFGFAHGTINGGTDWQQMYVNNAGQNPKNSATPKFNKYRGIGLENTTNWNMLWTDSTHLFASFSDINGVMSDDKGQTWKFIPNLTRNSVYHMVKHDNGTLYAATSSVHDLYQSTRLTDNTIDGGNGAIYFSKDNGASFNMLHDFTHPVVWLALDPSRPNRMYASVVHSVGGGIFVSDDIDKGAVSSWKRVTNPPRTEGHPFVIRVLKKGDLVVSFSGRRAGTPQQFTLSSGVFYSNDGGNSWIDKTPGLLKIWTKDVVIDPFDTTEKTWYAASFSGWGSVPANAGGLWRTTDQGITWTKISFFSATYRVNSCAINPSNRDEMYYTTETDGLWYSKNATSATPTFSLVSAYPFRHPVRVSFNPYRKNEIWVSGFGSGMMTSNISSGGTASFSEFKPEMKGIAIFPNPASGLIHFGSPGKGYWEIYDAAGRKVLGGVTVSGDPEVSAEVGNLPKGLYFLIEKAGNSVVSGKFIKE